MLCVYYDEIPFLFKLLPVSGRLKIDEIVVRHNLHSERKSSRGVVERR